MATAFAYIGVAECGCVRAAAADDPNSRQHTAADVADFIRDGLIIERVSVEQAPVKLCWADHVEGDARCKDGCPHEGECPERAKAEA